MELRVLGIKELVAGLTRLSEEAVTAAQRTVRRGQVVVNTSVKAQFTGAHPKGTPTPSPPGSPPAVITGTLRRSITNSPVRTAGYEARGQVYPTAVYARIQELGGTAGRGSVLPPRPYVAPGRDAVEGRLGEIAREEWAKVR